VTNCLTYAPIFIAPRRRAVNELFQDCVQQKSARHNFALRLGRFLVEPFFGSLVAMAVCYLIFYQLLGIFVAGTIVDFTEKQMMRVYYEPAIKASDRDRFPMRG